MRDHDPTMPEGSMDKTMRQLWARLEKPWIRRILQEYLPPSRLHTLGCEVIVHPSDNFTELKLWEKGELPEREATQYLMDEFVGQDVTIVDVGGNAGLFGMPILKAGGPNSKAIFFEPNPVMQARLSRNAEINDLEDRVTLMPFAVSDKEGEMPLYLPHHGNLGQGRLGVKYRNTDAKDALRVPVRVLPDCLKEQGVEKIDLLKVDVEGLEDRVIVPLLNDPDTPDPRFIYFEISHDGIWDLPLLSVLEKSGYREIRKFDYNALFQKS